MTVTPDEASWRRVNQQQLAELLGVHPDLLWKYVDRGMPILEKGGAGRGDRNFYDAVACLKWQRSRRKSHAKESAQLAKLTIDARIAQLELDERLGKVYPVAQVMHECKAMGRGFRAQLLLLPRRLVQRTGVEIYAEADALCREILTEVSSWKYVAVAEKTVATLTAEFGPESGKEVELDECRRTMADCREALAKLGPYRAEPSATPLLDFDEGEE